jgi:Domain of unknown function (DUF4276)
MTHVEFQVEEPSMEAALDGLLPRIIGDRATWKILNYRNKQRLLRNLRDRLRGYRARVPHENLKICVLIDRDEADCHTLKATLEEMAIEVGLGTKSSPIAGGMFHVVNRIVVCELEAWYFGEPAALRSIYPRLSEPLLNKSKYRNPDRISHTWETLARELAKASYHKHGFSKIGLAREMGLIMNPAHNTARSFNVFIEGLESIICLLNLLVLRVTG